MKIEILYPELGNLFGDSGNVKYLSLSLPEAGFVFTHLGQTPQFCSDTPDLIYMGPMTERAQARVLQELLPHRERLGALIDGGARFLCTGNAFELFGRHIECRGSGEKLDCLALLDFYAVRDLGSRYNGFFLGKYGEDEDTVVTGFNSRFSHAWPGAGVKGLFSVTRGIGLNGNCPFEGVRKNGFMGTYLLGPLLPLNPGFSRKLLAPLGGTPAFEDAAAAAFDRRVAEFSDPGRKLD